jgi:hypothetical protein
VANNENYEQNPGEYLEKTLESCFWRRVRDGEPRLWEKGRRRILVDHIGIFFYVYSPGNWVRRAGLAHNRIRHLPDCLIKFNDFTLDLLANQ